MDKLIEKYIELSCRVNDFFTIYNLPESERTDLMCGAVERLRGCEGPWSILPTEVNCSIPIETNFNSQQWSEPCKVCRTRFDTLIYVCCPVCEDGPIQLTPQSIIEMVPCYKCGSRPNQYEPQYDNVTICPTCKSFCKDI